MDTTIQCLEFNGIQYLMDLPIFLKICRMVIKHISRIGNIFVRLATKEDYNTAVISYSEFLKDRPVTYNASISHNDCVKAAEIFVNDHLRNGDIYLAENSKEVAAIFVGWDLTVLNPAAYHPFLVNHPHFSKVHKYNSTLIEKWMTLRGITPSTLSYGEVYHFTGGGIHRNFRGRGYTKTFLENFTDLAAKSGYKHVLQVSTNTRSRPLPGSYNTRVVLSLKFSDLFPGDVGFEKCIADGNDGAYLFQSDLY